MRRTPIIPIRLIQENHDTDWDGVPNFRDCNPWNPQEQDLRESLGKFKEKLGVIATKAKEKLGVVSTKAKEKLKEKQVERMGQRATKKQSVNYVYVIYKTDKWYQKGPMPIQESNRVIAQITRAGGTKVYTSKSPEARIRNIREKAVAVAKKMEPVVQTGIGAPLQHGINVASGRKYQHAPHVSQRQTETISPESRDWLGSDSYEKRPPQRLGIGSAFVTPKGSDSYEKRPPQSTDRVLRHERNQNHMSRIPSTRFQQFKPPLSGYQYDRQFQIPPRMYDTTINLPDANFKFIKYI